MKMKIAVDMDDVVVAMNEGCLKALNREYGVNMKLEDITYWNWWTGGCPIDFGPCTTCSGTGESQDVSVEGDMGRYGMCPTCRGTGERTMWNWFQDRSFLWPNFKPIDGALGGLDMLKRRGHETFLVTSKPEWAQFTAGQWMGNWKPHVRGLITVGTGESKLDVVGSWCDAIIDDKPKTIQEWDKAGRKSILFDRPWNRELQRTGVGNWFVADNWREILEIVTVWEKENEFAEQ